MPRTGSTVRSSPPNAPGLRIGVVVPPLAYLFVSCSRRGGALVARTRQIIEIGDNYSSPQEPNLPVAMDLEADRASYELSISKALPAQPASMTQHARGNYYAL